MNLGAGRRVPGERHDRSSRGQPTQGPRTDRKDSFEPDSADDSTSEQPVPTELDTVPRVG